MATTGNAPLNLIKPEAADVVSLSVINNNYDTINSNAASVATTLTTHTGQLTALETNLAAWVSYTPTLGGGLASGFTVNNAFYGRAGKTILVRGVLSCSGAVAGSGLNVTLPVEAKANLFLFTGWAVKTTGLFPLTAFMTTNSGVTRGSFYITATNGAYAQNVDLSTSVPATWTSDDSIYFMFAYEGV